MPSTHGPALCPQSVVRRQVILRRVYEQNLGIGADRTTSRPTGIDGAADSPLQGSFRWPSPHIRKRPGARTRNAAAALATMASLLVPVVPDSGWLPGGHEGGSPPPAHAGSAAVPGVAIGLPPAPEPLLLSSATVAGSPAANTAVPAGGTGPAEGMLAAEGHPPVAALFGLNVRTIVLDPGHGGVDPGALGALVGGRRLREKDLTLDVAKRLATRLRQDEGFKVLLTREGDETMSLARRVEIANAAGPDLFVSVHANALGDARANAVETYYFGAPRDSDTWQLARQENAGSGLRIGAFRELVETLADTLKRQESLALARSIQVELLNRVMHRTGPLHAAAPGAGVPVGSVPIGSMPVPGVKVAPFVVLIGVEVPSVLAEVTCISNRSEAQRLASPAYRQAIAEALGRGIVNYVARRNGNDNGATKHEQTISEGESRGKGNG